MKKSSLGIIWIVALLLLSACSILRPPAPTPTESPLPVVPSDTPPVATVPPTETVPIVTVTVTPAVPQAPPTVTAVPAPKTSAPVPPVPVGGAPTIFGVHIEVGANYPRPNPSQLAQMGIKATSFWLYLPQYTDATGKQVNTARIVQLINEIKQGTGGIDLYVHLMSNRAGTGQISVPDIPAYASQVGQVAAALKGKVKAYAILNEISPQTFTGSAEQYGAMLAAAYKSIKQADPGVEVTDSGMASLTFGLSVLKSMSDEGQGQAAINFANAYYAGHGGPVQKYLPVRDANGLKTLLTAPEVVSTLTFSAARFREWCNSYDVLQMHFYQPWANLAPTIAWVKSEMAATHCVKPIQIWELGYGVDLLTAGGAPFNYSVGEHAISVAKLLTIAGSNQLQTVLYFPYFDRGTYARGLLTASGGVQPPATAYSTTVNKISGATATQNLSDGKGTYIFRFQKASGDVFAVWSDNPGKVSLPTNATSATITGIDGKSTTGDPRAISTTTSPVFIEVK